MGGWVGWGAVGTAAGMVAVGTGMVGTPPAPPAGAVGAELTHGCRVVTAPSGFRVVDVTGSASAWVGRIPARPWFTLGEHRIRQRIDVHVERRVVGGWKGPRHRVWTDPTVRGEPNTGRARVTERVGPTLGTRGLWRVRASVRVLTTRDGIPDRPHWAYEIWGEPFTCNVAVDDILFDLEG